MDSNCSNSLYLRNLQEFCYQKLFWPFTIWINCSSHLKHFANSRPSASSLKSFSWSIEQFFLTVGQNNFGNKIPFLIFVASSKNRIKVQNSQKTGTCINIRIDYCISFGYSSTILFGWQISIFIRPIHKKS